MELLLPIFKTAALLTLFLSVYLLLLKKTTHFALHRWFLIVGIIISSMMPYLIYETIVEKDIAMELISPASSTATDTFAATQSITWQDILLYTYIIGTAGFVFHLLLQLGMIFRILHRLKSAHYGGFRYYKSDKEIAPFSFFNHIVYNPNLHSASELQMILAHERAHAKQGHSVDILLVNLMLCTQWCNPFAWLYRKEMLTNLEYLADKASISKAPSSRTYQLALVRNAIPVTAPALANTFYQSNIKKRIIMLNKNASNRFHKLKVIAILPILAIFFLSFNVKETIKWNIIESDPMPETTSEFTQNPNEFSKTSSEDTEATDRERTNVSKRTISTPTMVKNSKSPTVETLQEVVHVTITKNSSDSDLDEMKNTLKNEHDIDFDYNRVKRNDSEEIIGIRIQISDNKSGNSTQYQTKSDTPINDIHIIRNAKGGLSVGNRKSSGSGNRAMVIQNSTDYDDEEIREEMEQRRRELEERRAEMEVEREMRRKEMDERRKEMREEMKLRRDSLGPYKNRVRSGNMDDSIHIIRNRNRNTVFGMAERNNDGQPLIVVDGDVRKRDALQEISPEEIASVTVLKGEKAVEKYGPKAMDGVIEIITKE